MMADFRALCAELLDWADVTAAHYIQLPAVMLRARAALADGPAVPIPPAALPEGYIDPEHSGDDRALLQTFYSACLAEGGTADEITLRGLRAVLADGPAVPEGREPASVVEEPSDRDLRQLYADTFDLRSDPASLGPAIVKFARAVLARWGTPALPPPTDKEPTRLRNCPTHGQQPPWAWGCPECVRQLREELAALQQRHPEPVPVSERLPGPEDCDEDGRCWWLHVGADGVGDWLQRAPYPSVTSYAFFRMTHWLPAHALPLPGQEWLPAHALPVPGQEAE